MLSPKKQKFIDFIKDFTSEKHRPPTFVEIMKGLNFSSLGTINWYIVELEKAGMIERVKGFNGKRALSILESKIDNRLPLLGVVSAGVPLEMFDNQEYIDVPEMYCKRDNFVLRVDGDSMIEDGILDSSLYKIIYKWKNLLGSKLKVIKIKENKGLANALNNGLRNCEYELVARMDSITFF